MTNDGRPPRRPTAGERPAVLGRLALAYLVCGAIVAEAVVFLARRGQLPNVALELTLSLLLLGLPAILIGGVALEESGKADRLWAHLARSPVLSGTVLTALAAVAILAGAGGWLAFPGASRDGVPSPGGGPTRSAASMVIIAPAIDHEHPDDAGLAALLSSRLRENLARLPSVTLLGDSIVDQYRAPGTRESDAQLRLEAMLRRQRQGVRLAVEVLDARSGRRILLHEVSGSDPTPEDGDLTDVDLDMEDLIQVLGSRLGLTAPK